jgi:selenocysteine lyase/cysteine desulfurase
VGRRAHEVGAIVVVDASQACRQLPTRGHPRRRSVAFTGHKMVGRPASACCGSRACCERPRSWAAAR